MNLLTTEILLLYEVAKIYDEYKVLLRLEVKKYGNYRRCFSLYANDEIIFKSCIWTKGTLLKILQDKNDGLYSDKYNIIMDKIRSLAVKEKPMIKVVQ
jgi:hypothetical protein